VLQRLLAKLLADAALSSVRYPRLLALSKAAIAILAGLATTLRPLPLHVAAQCCTGPNGSGGCYEGYCDGSACVGLCENISGYCPSGSCWCSFLGCGGVECCDCFCYDPYSNLAWNCYCSGFQSYCAS
jgi:hypothetical protein